MDPFGNKGKGWGHILDEEGREKTSQIALNNKVIGVFHFQ